MLHLSEPIQKPATVPRLDQTSELPDASRSANEELNATGVARNVWFFFLCQTDLQGLRANRAGELVVGLGWHSAPQPDRPF
jgi:hypothetical protein